MEARSEPDDFWAVVAEQSAKYGAYDDNEVEWGEDVGSECLD